MLTSHAPRKLGRGLTDSDHILRAHSIQSLDAIAQERICVVDGLPGSGRTTLIAQWRTHAEENDRPVAWLTLDPSDKQPRNLVTHLLDAFRTVDVTVNEPDGLRADASTSSTAPHIEPETAARCLLATIVALNTHVWLVIDDADIVLGTPAMTVVNHLLAYAPSTLHVILCVRSAATVAGMLPVGALGVLDRSVLTVSEDELRELLESNGEPTTLEHVIALARRTGSHPLAISGELGGPGAAARASEALRTAAERLIFDLPEPLSDFLITLSLVDEITADMARALSQTQRAPRILRELVDQGYLTTRWLDGAFAYRITPWISPTVRSLFDSRFTPSEQNHLHSSTAEWYSSKGRTLLAARHFYLAGEAERAETHLARSLGDVFTGELSPRFALQDVVFPDRVLETSAHANALVGSALSLDDPWSESAGRHLDRARGLAATMDEDARRAITAVIDMVELQRAFYDGDGILGLERSDELLDLSDRQLQHLGLSVAQVETAVLPYHAMFTLWSGHSAEAAETLDHALATATSEGSSLWRAVTHIHRDHLNTAVCSAKPTPEWIDALTAEAAENGWCDRYEFAAIAAIGARASLHRYDLDEAAEAIENLRRRFPRRGTLLETELEILDAERALANDETDAARQHAVRARSLLDGTYGPQSSYRPLLLPTLVRVAVATEDDDGVGRLLSPTQVNGTMWLRPFLATLDIQRGDYASALRSLEPLLAVSADLPATVVVDGAIAEAHARYRLDQRVLTNRALRRALLAARAEAIRRPFVEQDDWLDAALQDHFAADPEFAEQVAAIRAGAATRRRRESVATPRTSQLTKSEREVLIYLVSGATKQAIARNRNVSMNTVKTQVRSIYRKLGVTERADAVRYLSVYSPELARPAQDLSA